MRNTLKVLEAYPAQQAAGGKLAANQQLPKLESLLINPQLLNTFSQENKSERNLLILKKYSLDLLLFENYNENDLDLDFKETNFFRPPFILGELMDLLYAIKHSYNQNKIFQNQNQSIFCVQPKKVLFRESLHYNVVSLIYQSLILIIPPGMIKN